MTDNLPATNEHFILSTVGVEIVGKPSYEEWERMLHMMFANHRMSHWVIGDLIRFGEAEYGEKYSQALDATVYAYSTLAHDVSVAGKFEICRRRQNLSWGHHAEVGKLAPAKQDELLERAEVEQWPISRLREECGGAHVGHNSGDNEWYTPEKYIEAARRTMGRIDLDPASTAEANAIVKAAKFFDTESDGLAHHWEGRLWMNPPYSQPLIEHFIQKMVRCFKDGDVKEACVLVNNATETGWFQELADSANAVCFPCGRIRFWHHEKEGKCAPLQGQGILYFGKNAGRFKDAYDEFGTIFVGS